MTDGTVEIYFHDYQEEKRKHEAPKIYKHQMMRFQLTDNIFLEIMTATL